MDVLQAICSVLLTMHTQESGRAVLGASGAGVAMWLSYVAIFVQDAVAKVAIGVPASNKQAFSRGF